MNERRAYRSFVSYIDRSRKYYAAAGYPQPYTWAHYKDVPFTKLGNQLSQSRVGLVTTASPVEIEETEWLTRGRKPYVMATSSVPARMYTTHLFWDKKATHTDDVDSFLPLRRLAEYAAEGRIASVSSRFYGAPTDYSQGNTTRKAAPQILEWCREDGVDVVLLSAL